jgi:urease accessory protein
MKRSPRPHHTGTYSAGSSETKAPSRIFLRKGASIYRYVPWLSSLAVLVVPTLASAHPGHGAGNAAAAGFAHPFTGLDHLLAMLAVGLWAAQLGGRARWMVPASFVAAMTVGGAMAFNDITLTIVEPAIITSVLVLGVLIAIAARMPVVVASAVVGLFAIFHGYAHVSEVRQGDAFLAYAAGFVVASALLHTLGLALGILFQQSRQPVLTRICGGLVTLAAVTLWIGAR